jgi:methionyl aminopeptidase
MLTNKEVEQMRKNAQIHKKVFEEIKKIAVAWTTMKQVNILCWEIAKKNNVLCAFKGAYGFPDNICISINDEIAHWTANRNITFKNWDLVNFDFWIRDKGLWINTDTGFTMIIWWDEYNPVWAKMIEVNKKALYAWIAMCRAWNRVWDISYAIEKEIIKWGFKIVKDLTGHAVWKKLHEKPYIPNHGKPWTWELLKVGMTLAIEPLIWETSWEIVDEWSYEIYIEDGSLGCQFEHNVLITNWEPEIIV